MLAFAQEGDYFSVGCGGGILGAGKECQEAVARLEGRGDETWAGVVLVAAKTAADQVLDRVDPVGSRGQVGWQGDARDLAQEGAVKGEA